MPALAKSDLLFHNLVYCHPITWEYTCIPDRGLCTYLPTSYQTRLYTLDRDQQEQQRQLPNVDRQSQDPEQPQPSTQLPKTLDQWCLAQFR